MYLPIRNEDGSISGFVGFADGQLKMPPQWLHSNVVKLKRDLKVGTLIACLIVSVVWHAGERLVNSTPRQDAETRKHSSSTDFGTADVYPTNGGDLGGGYDPGDYGGGYKGPRQKAPKGRHSSLEVLPASYNPGRVEIDNYNAGTYVSAPSRS